jgi:hypothetical protein
VRASEMLPDVRNIELVEWKNKNLYVVSSFEKRDRFVFFYAVEIMIHEKMNNKNDLKYLGPKQNNNSEEDSGQNKNSKNVFNKNNDSDDVPQKTEIKPVNENSDEDNIFD